MNKSRENPQPASAAGDFAEAVAAGTPTPGGGSVAAYCGVLATALGRMMCNLTLGKPKHAAVQSEIVAAGEDLARIGDRLKQLIDRDAASFEAVLAAYRLPKDSEEQKAERSRRIEQALKGAASTPLETAKTARDALTRLRGLAGIGNPNALPDLAVGGRLAQAAIRGAYYNIAVNLATIKDQTFAAEVRREIEELSAEGDSLAGDIESAFLSTLGES